MFLSEKLIVIGKSGCCFFVTRSKMRCATTLLYCFPFCFMTYVSGQSDPPPLVDTAPPPSARFLASWYPADDNVTYKLRVEKNLPYTAVAVITDQYESGGQVITHATSTVQARDSASRTHEENGGGGFTNSQGEKIETRTITVTDPVSHCKFRWIEPTSDSEKAVALVKCMPRTMHYINQNAQADQFASSLLKAFQDVRSSNGIVVEPLSRKAFGEVQADGVRTTPASPNSSNGPVEQHSTEIWYSRDIHELVLMNFNALPDSKSAPNEKVPYFELKDIKRIEPEPTLFYPPVGFEIQPLDFQ